MSRTCAAWRDLLDRWVKAGLFFALPCLFLTSGCVAEKTPPHSASLEKVRKEFVEWHRAHWPREEAEDYVVETELDTRTVLPGVEGTVVLQQYSAQPAGSRSRGGWFRARAKFLNGSRHNEEEVIFDTGFYMPDCGGQGQVSLGRISSFRLAGIPIIAIDERVDAVACDVAPFEKSVKTHFFAAQEGRIREVLTLETSSLKSDDRSQRPVRMLDTIYYENGCADRDSCGYITVWTFDATRSRMEVSSYSWNGDRSRLVRNGK